VGGKHHRKSTYTSVEHPLKGIKITVGKFASVERIPATKQLFKFVNLNSLKQKKINLILIYPNSTLFIADSSAVSLRLLHPLAHQFHGSPFVRSPLAIHADRVSKPEASGGH